MSLLNKLTRLGIFLLNYILLLIQFKGELNNDDKWVQCFDDRLYLVRPLWSLLHPTAVITDNK